MPKYGIHHIVLDSCKNQLAQDAHDIAQILEDNSAIAKLGSIGPDLFFWGTDYDLVQKYLKVYEGFKGVVDIYKKVMKPIEEINEEYVEPVEETIEDLFPNTTKLLDKLNEVEKATEDYCSNAKLTTIFAGVIEGLDLAHCGTAINAFYQWFEPEHYYNRPEIDWYWFDMLHYRQSGAFAQNLIELAELADNDKQKAYAYGYLTHIATDVMGHPYVNQMVGAPYRSNIWRHVTVESYLDTWKFSEYYDESINEKLRERLELPKVDKYFRNTEELDDDIVGLLYSAFRKTYSEVLHPIRLNHKNSGGSYSTDNDGFYTEEDIKDTYDTFVQFVNYVEQSYVSPPKEPFDGVMDILADVLNGTLPPLPAPPETPSSSSCSWEDIFSTSPDCQDDLKDIIEEWTRYAQGLSEWLGQVIAAIIAAIVDTITTSLALLPATAFMALLYAIQLAAYEIYKGMRNILSLHGLVYPEPYDLSWGIGDRLTTLLGSCGEKYYPSTGMPSRSNLDCPVEDVEKVSTQAGFYVHGSGSDANSFIGEATQTIDLDNLKAYVDCEHPDGTRTLEDDKKLIGSAIPLSLWMMKNATDPNLKKYVFANWNLDSDRGYGYKEWHGFQNKTLLPHNTQMHPELYLKDSHADSVGDNCFDFFNATVQPDDKPNIVNAYLLSIACQFDYLDQLYIPTPWDADAKKLYEQRFGNLMGRWGLDSTKFNFISKTTRTTDTQVVLMPNSDASNPFIIVLFRGSESPLDLPKAFKDWISTDFNAFPPVSSNEQELNHAGVKFHKGFWKAFDTVKKDILRGINSIKNDNPSVDYKIWVTGNSLGAGLANICGLWLDIHGCPVEGVYSFAAPKCANSEFTDLYEQKMEKRCHRWVNGRIDQANHIDHRDIVTQVPPSPGHSNCEISLDYEIQAFLQLASPTLTFPFCFDHVGHEHQVDETDKYLFDQLIPMLPTKIRAHLTEGYSRGIYKQLIEEHLQIAMRVPLPSA